MIRAHPSNVPQYNKQPEFVDKPQKLVQAQNIF